MESAPQPLAPQSGIVLLILNYDDKNTAEKDFVRGLSDGLRQSEEKVISVIDLWGPVSTLYVWAFENQVPAIMSRVRDVLHREPIIKRDFIESASTAQAPVDRAEYFKFEGIERLRLAAAAFEQLEKTISKMTPEQIEKSALEVAWLLDSLEYTLAQHLQTGQRLESWANNGAAKENFSKKFMAPLRKLLTRGYEILDTLKTPLARKILLFKGQDAASRIHFLERLSGVESKTYFQHWLDLLSEKIRWIESASSEERKDMNVSNRSGGILSQFGFLNVRVKDYQPAVKNSLVYFPEDSKMFPLLIFGLSDNPVNRSDLLRFIMEMDKSVEWQLQDLSGESDAKNHGSKTLFDLLNALAYPGYKSETDEIPGFSRARYFSQAMMIVSELLNTSRVTIANSATYLSILNAAISLQKFVTKEFGIVPNAQIHSAELNDLTEQLMHLHQAVQLRMLRQVFLDPKIRSGKCEGALKPL